MTRKNPIRWMVTGTLVFLILFPMPATAGRLDLEQERSFSAPLFMRNDSPLHLTFFSTALPDRAAVVEPQKFQWEVGYLNSNTAVQQHNVIESDFVLVDGELQRVELSVKYGLAENWELAATLPYLFFGSGYMDGFIEDFEEAFGVGIPGARKALASGHMRYLVRVNGQNIIDESDGAIQGLGDLPLQLKYRLRNERDGVLPRLSVRGMVKFPSATDPLLGTRRLGGGVGLLAEQPLGDRILLIANGDVTAAKLPLAFKTIDIDRVIGSGAFAFEHFLTDRFSWQAQFMISSNPYPKFHPDITAFNRIPMGAGLGFTYRSFKRTRLKFSAVENISGSWSDFSWGAALQGEY